MSATAKVSARPRLILSETDADRLFLLAERARDQTTLLGELERAQVRQDHLVPANVIGMNSTVDFIDDAHGQARTVQLVYPAQADIAEGRISVLTPIGAGLIGLTEGQSINWPDRDGRLRPLRVLKVTRS